MVKRAVADVPGSLGNVGSGFDCLGLALNLRNRVMIEERDEPGVAVEVRGEGEKRLPLDENNFIARSALRVYELIGQDPTGLAVITDNVIPLARGLGSSGTAAVAGMACANALTGFPLSDSDILEEAAHFEGHPDNVVPSVLGGFTLSMWVGRGKSKRLLYDSIPVPTGLSVVVAIPEFTLETKKAREVLPSDYPRHVVVHNLARASWAVRCFMSGDFETLATALDDRIHQPYRARLVPGFDLVREAACDGGALATCLSGAGPTVAAFCTDYGEEIGTAMMQAFSSSGVPARYIVLEPDNQGLEVSVDEVADEE